MANRFAPRFGLNSMIVGLRDGKPAPLVDQVDRFLLALDEKGTGVKQVLRAQLMSSDAFALFAPSNGRARAFLAFLSVQDGPAARRPLTYEDSWALPDGGRRHESIGGRSFVVSPPGLAPRRGGAVGYNQRP